LAEVKIRASAVKTANAAAVANEIARQFFFRIE
jgi:hypothetical protein